MIKIVEVQTQKQRKQFVKFQMDLYKNCPQYVPQMVSDEVNLLNPKKNANAETCEIKSFLAYSDDKIVGRITGLIQKASNEKAHQRYVRFTRFDCIDDQEVANALINAVETWAKEQRLNYIQGPLGYNDLDILGLLVEGFDEMAVFEESYNYSYYAKLLENQGFTKDADWLEYRFKVPKTADPRFARIAESIGKKYNLRLVSERTTKAVIEKYKDQIFELIDLCYSPLYGVVPLPKDLQAQFIEEFKLLIDRRFISMVVNEDNMLVGFALIFPDIAEVMKKSKGRIFSPHIFELLHTIKKPKVVDTPLIAVHPDYRTKGVSAFLMNELLNNLIKLGVEEAESLFQLETNIAIKNQFDMFERRQHKRRRCYLKKI